jgi:hypothetical protein
LILEDRREDALRGTPPDAIRDKVTIGWNEMHCFVIFEKMDATSNVKVGPIPCGWIPLPVL